MKGLLKLRSLFRTQKEMAEELGLAESVISDWLSESKKPSVKNAKLIQFLYGIPREEIRPDIFGK